MKIAGCRGSLGGEKLRRCELRPHLNPLPGGEEVTSLPPFGIPAPHRGTGQAFDCRNYEVGARINEGMPRMANERLLDRCIPDRGPGHAFIAKFQTLKN